MERSPDYKREVSNTEGKPPTSVEIAAFVAFVVAAAGIIWGVNEIGQANNPPVSREAMERQHQATQTAATQVAENISQSGE